MVSRGLAKSGSRDYANLVLRTFVLATVAVPIVIYGLMPQLHHARIHILSRGDR